MNWNIPSLTKIDAGYTDQAATICYEAFKNDPVIAYVAADTATPDDLKRVWSHTYNSLPVSARLLPLHSKWKPRRMAAIEP